MKLSVQPYGTIGSGEQAALYTLENNHGLSVSITNFGGVITSLMAPDKHGAFADIVLAHKGVEEYLENPGSLGAIIGRNANRIRNASVNIDGIDYDLIQNDGKNNLHTGPKGLQYRLFDAEATTNDDTAVLRLSTVVLDLEDGFPGNLEVEIYYTLTNDNALVIDYYAVADKDTVINLTNHSYFNLAGHDAGQTIGDHTLWMASDFYSPNDEESLPTGEVLSVTDTPMDFTSPTALGPALESNHQQIQLLLGIDNNFMLNGDDYRRVATLTHPESGRVMHVSTDQPALHLYTGNHLPTIADSKDGATYLPHGGICFETQTVPNAATMPWLASPLYGAGTEYITTTTFRFDVIDEEEIE